MSPLSKSHRLQWTVIGGVIGLMWVLVGMVTWPVRSALQEQVLRREADSIAAVAILQRGLGAERYRALGIEPSAMETFEALLESAQLDGVVALQLYGADGQAERELPILAYVEALDEVKRVSQPAANLHPQGATVEGAGDALGDLAGPWLEVIVPLYEAESDSPQSWARYWIDGRRVAAEWGEIDRQLARIAGTSAVGGAVVLAVVLLWAFSRLQRQADDLARANRELLLHTKTAAIGAISSHLIHGLKNPLAGLEGFIAEAPDGAGSDDRSGVAWREAAETTRRVRRLVNEVLDVLREMSSAGDYFVPVGEVIEGALSRVEDLALAAEVKLTTVASGGDQEIAGNTAALAGLVIHNLLENAIEASTPGSEITIRVAGLSSTRCSIEITDTGAGLPGTVKSAAFAPVVSTKAGGAGLGLALSHQLARHAGGSLHVIRSDAGGTCFGLELPIGIAAIVKN